MEGRRNNFTGRGEIMEQESVERSEKGMQLIHDLELDIEAGRSSEFNRAFLQQINHNPDSTIRECWEAVENHFATQNRVRPRQYPFKFNN
ncbi:MAG: hypothetical protein HYV32_00665 [Candidatus Kerfeldbacteria bacterium]|nr:hypothetical protein [Candidatus Kerfeldbacteria bacterium]